MKEIILATSNPGKIVELNALLSPIHCMAQTDLGIHPIEENGLSFIENAILKARHASRLGKKPALADDSGLVVKSIHGQPGIRSARFAGDHANDADNIEKLLFLLKEVPDNQRQAYFYCAMALVRDPEDPIPVLSTGQIEGSIAQALSGENGFGYDPIFYLPQFGCTMAKLPVSTKNTISHRAQALQSLAAQLRGDEWD